MDKDKALAVVNDETSLQITTEEVKKYIAKDATDKELFMFMGICKSYNLNPFKKEIHFVKYKSKDGINKDASIIVGYETYLKRAEATGKLDGWRCWIEGAGTAEERAIVEIHRKDRAHPLVWEAYRSEFDKGQSTWKAMPIFMLKKVCIAQGFRLAFPEDLGGLPYTFEEHDFINATKEPTKKGFQGKKPPVKTTQQDSTPPPDAPVTVAQIRSLKPMFKAVGAESDPDILQYFKDHVSPDIESLQTIKYSQFSSMVQHLKNPRGSEKEEEECCKNAVNCDYSGWTDAGAYCGKNEQPCPYDVSLTDKDNEGQEDIPL